MGTLSVLAALALPIAAQAQDTPAVASPPVAKPITPYKIILVGDSTTAVIGGWGPSFCAYHVTSFTACVNLARGGRSSGSYRAEGSWDVALAEMRTPGYKQKWVLIQFGHNDQPGKPGRSTDLATGFPANLARYIDEARAAGAEPILVTPLTRRMFKEGRLENDLAPWAAAARRIASEKRVRLIDLNARSSAAVQAMGETAADRFAQLPPGSVPIGPSANSRRPEIEEFAMAQPRLSFDRTHLGREGADYFAKMVTEELAKGVPEMRHLLVP